MRKRCSEFDCENPARNLFASRCRDCHRAYARALAQRRRKLTVPKVTCETCPARFHRTRALRRQCAACMATRRARAVKDDLKPHVIEAIIARRLLELRQQRNRRSA